MKFHRKGSTTKAELNVVAQLVADHPGELNNEQVKALSTLLRRPLGTTKDIIQRARDTFAANAETYAEVHLQATVGALARADYDTAAKAAQWAMQNIQEDGVRVVDRPNAEANTGTKVLIGFAVGGLGHAIDAQQQQQQLPPALPAEILPSEPVRDPAE